MEGHLNFGPGDPDQALGTESGLGRQSPASIPAEEKNGDDSHTDRHVPVHKALPKICCI